MKRIIKLNGSIIVIIIVLLSLQSFVFGAADDNEQKYYFSEKHKVSTNDGFSLSKEKKINEDDVHYGWDLGRFYISGYTQRESDEEGNPIFLKNPGDNVVLGFELEEDINKLNGNKNLSIGEDKKAFDEHFEISKTNFKHGALIIQRTNHQNIVEEPIIYTDYLSAKSKVNANTVIKLKQEGDYEVALDYVIKNDPRKILGKSIIPMYYDYTIRMFKFSVRNGDSMVFLIDAVTGSTLGNQSFTENGFKIDFANSHYLKVYVKKQVLNRNDAEDVTQNKPAKDGDVFTDEGLYTITVEDPATKQTTTKTIYVGIDEKYKAYVTTGLTLEEIDSQLEDGANITNNGSIVPANDEIVLEESTPEEHDSSFSGVLIALLSLAVIIALLAIYFRIRRHRKAMKQ